MIPSDDDGSADPLCMIYHFGQNARTFDFPNTLNPTWNQRKLMVSKVILS